MFSIWYCHLKQLSFLETSVLHNSRSPHAKFTLTPFFLIRTGARGQASLQTIMGIMICNEASDACIIAHSGICCEDNCV